ncbi:MAG: Tex family protein [Halopseudomonas sp.]
MIVRQLSQQLQLQPRQVEAFIKLFDEGASVPFIARYRKEQTGGLDDAQLRGLEQQLVYQRQLEQRRQSIIQAVDQLQRLSAPLRQLLLAATTKNELEELYQPYKSQRRTRAQTAREAGLEPLLNGLLASTNRSPQSLARSYLNPKAGFNDIDTVLDGAAAILHARIAEHPSLSSQLRVLLWKEGQLEVSVVKGKADSGAKFRDYFDYQEAIKRIPSHRALAILRGCKEAVLRVKLQLNPTDDRPTRKIQQALNFPNHGPCRDWLQTQQDLGWHKKLQPQLQKSLLNQLREQAEAEAIRVFGLNLKQLLLAAPAGHKATLALDPGFRNGVKVAAVDGTGKLLDHTVVYPHPPQQRWDDALASLRQLCLSQQIELISIGNGTASRETEKLVSELLADPALQTISKVTVSEAGASVYSASELAGQEFPDLDVSIRGAVSIARRLQDPLSELVKIDPKAIGVGQYQHDVNQPQLAEHLNAVVEDCVNAVGVDLNSASPTLLQYVCGITPTLASNIVAHRDLNGPFNGRSELKKVARLGPKAFEQAAGFLRISNARQPLDGSAVHPEAYSLVKTIAAKQHKTIASLMGQSELLRQLNPADYTDAQFGIPTIKDILTELEKPGRDPRPELVDVKFTEGVTRISDLKLDMRLQGIVTNVTNFGAFVDIGVHQDGLVHISQLANRFIRDPHEIVKPGDIINVRILEVDSARKRVALTLKDA